MRDKILKNISVLSILSCLIFCIAINGHGFGAHTLIQLSHQSQQSIHTICLNTLHNSVSVASYDLNNFCTTNKLVKIGRKSKTNCYIKLCFDDEYHDDIICTPTQEFYEPTNQSWIPTYMLKIGDALLTKDMTTKIVKHKQFVPKFLKVYMIEVQDTHTFFVGKYGILTHNIFLPLGVSLGFSVPFGSVATGAAGSFFGPIGLMGGIVLGGIVSVAIKALYENHIHSYKTPIYNVASIEYYCHNMVANHDTNTSQSSGCFIPDQTTDAIICTIPIEHQMSEAFVGCIEIEVKNLHNNGTHTYDNANENEIEFVEERGCFNPAEQNEKELVHKQEKITESENTKIRYREKARNWDEFEKNCHMGQKYGKKFVHTGKHNPKDGSPIRQLSQDIPEAEMFKKNYFFAPDRFHDGDHFEVWDKKGNWVGVANLDGSKNHKKTNTETDKQSRNIKKII